MAAIVFDLDGTLIDSAPDIHAVANALLAGEGRDPITLDETRRFIGNGAAVLVQRMRQARGIPDSEQARLFAAFMARYDTAVHLTEPYPGVPQALATLRASGHRLGVCTNKPHRPAMAVLAHLELDRFFETVLGGDSMAAHKPDPAPLHAAFNALGETALFYVGDSEVDAETAMRARVPFLLYGAGYRKASIEEMLATAVFANFDQLPGLIETLLTEAA
ncbi:Phosphoglycolate phosphatase, chromosomal [Hartmannibacter diazotrophicus]|uniref:Phosphoglycolate phosphatase n=1 Tax=Hartmannibacter diazotrophicus TaxID=1482074 RepID=A0A2C9DAV8_9HYPH|nr:phosphoglycolate phosphatase [Hartmannibacter diazotrophicus]SON57396.1 Phosphoglycolate phosphatase, chromosomal [Hartmannibacter diazotrophicus]